MKQFRILLLLIIIGLLSCKNGINGQNVDNTKPMYGEVPKSDEYKKADEDFKKECLDRYKTIDNSVDSLTNNAWIYFYNNDLKTAMKRFNQVWLLNPAFPDSYFGFAALMDMQNNKTESARFYKMGIEKDKDKNRTHICYQRIADCKEQLKDFKGAIDAYTKITVIDPTNAFAYKKIGYFQMEFGSFDEAIFAFKKAIELDSTDAMTYNNRGFLYHSKKMYKQAINDFTKAIKLDSKYIGAYVNRGISEMAESNFDKAKKDFEICVQLDSKSGELRRYLGLAKLNLKDKLGACKDFNLAKQLGDLQADGLIIQNCK
jgi:tetratricopeptide (TPR) repeat protein